MVFISNNADTKILFPYSKQFFGGTEYMAKNVLEKVVFDLPNFNNYDCFVVPGNVELNANSPKDRILWIHNYPYEFGPDQTKILIDWMHEEKTKFIILVSEKQKEVFVKEFGVSEEKIHVIPNAIELSTPNLKKFDSKTIDIVHTSSPDRGMTLLLKSLKYIKEDFVLRIFNNFDPNLYDDKNILDMCNDKRIIFYGKTPKQTVLRYLENSHIHAYPSLHPETFCLSQAEAMSAGLLNVYSKIGHSAVGEITKDHGIEAQLNYKDEEEDAKIFAKSLSEAIKKIKNKEFDPTDQINYINNTYSWDVAIKNWKEFHNII
jgi:glycosyltransferase involved in cell wall biosynthesis